MEVNFASLYKLFDDDKAMKNAMMWITKNLKKTKITATLGKNIIFFLELESVVGVFFPIRKNETQGIIQCAMLKCSSL